MKNAADAIKKWMDQGTKQEAFVKKLLVICVSVLILYALGYAVGKFYALGCAMGKFIYNLGV